GADYGPWSVWFSDTNYEVQEPATLSTTADITIRRTPGSSEPVAVFYTTNGTATAGSDYAQVFRQLVYFDDNETVKTVPITIYSDGIAEGDETVTLSLRNPTGGPVRGAPGTATLTIHDANTPRLVLVGDPGLLEGNAGTSPYNFYAVLVDPITNLP